MAGECPSPSSLPYKDRLRLKEKDDIAYAALYSTSAGQNVFGRLTSDASGRQLRSSLGSCLPPKNMPWPEYLTSSADFYSQGNLSGFVANSNRVVYTHTTFKSGYQPCDRPQLDTFVPHQLRRYKMREPYDYMATIRPDTETTNQTFRMMGTYPSDHAAAKQAGLFMPSGCPGGPPSFHPDVRPHALSRRPATTPLAV